MAMNPEIKAQWVAALRSGDYEQGAGNLCVVDSEGEHPEYCCLGVLEHLRELSGAPVKVATDAFGVVSFDGEEQTLSRVTIEWSGIRDENPVVDYNDGYVTVEGGTLADLNDGGMSFEEIADLIEAQL